MNWFKRLFGFVGKIFKTAAKTTIGQTVDLILPTVMPAVKNLENSQMTGAQKLKYVAESVSDIYGKIESVPINLAVNLALAVIREGVKGVRDESAKTK